MIDAVELGNKTLVMADRDELIKYIEEKLSEKIVGSLSDRYTSIAYDKMHKLLNIIESRIVEKVCERILNEKYQEIFAKINLDTVANMAAVNIAKKMNT